eukprot:6570401-Prymnesium_polylepis.1
MRSRGTPPARLPEPCCASCRFAGPSAVTEGKCPMPPPLGLAAARSLAAIELVAAVDRGQVHYVLQLQ